MPPIVEETQVEGGPRMTRLSCIQSFLPSIFAIAAIILGTGANVYCEVVKFPQVQGNTDLVLFAGPWFYRTPDAYEWGDNTFVFQTCRPYDYLQDNLGFDYTVDAKTKTVWAFAVMTPMIGALLILFSCWGPCNGASASRWKCMGSLFILLSVFQGITLLIQSSSICYDNPAIQYLEVNNPDLAKTLPEQCEWAAGFKVNIAAVVLWFLAGACSYAFPPPLVIHEHPRQDQTVTYTQNLNGTVEETHVTIVKGTPAEQKVSVEQ